MTLVLKKCKLLISSAKLYSVYAVFSITLYDTSKTYFHNNNGQFQSAVGYYCVKFTFYLKIHYEKKWLWTSDLSIFLSKNVMVFKQSINRKVFWISNVKCRSRVRSELSCGTGHDHQLLSITSALYLCCPFRPGKFPNVLLCAVDRSGGVERGHRPKWLPSVF